MKGSCLCGEVRYQVERLESPIKHCSCHSCRKAHAAAFNTMAVVNKARFQWLSGEQLLSAYESSPGKRRRFCSRCGSQMVAEYEGRDVMGLRVATLDDDPGTMPAVRIWQSHEVPWLSYTHDYPAYPEGEPESR